MVLIPSFKEYLAKLPTEVVFRHFLPPQVHSRKILSSSAIDEITRQMSSDKSIRARFSKLSPSGKYTVSLVYLFGKKGLETQVMTGFDEELLGSFLVFAGKNETGKMFLFGFQELEASLAPLAAAVITDKSKTPAPKETSAETTPSWLCLNDVTILCICASAGMLRLTRKGSFAKVSENAFKIFLHALREMAVPQRILFNYALEKGLMLLDKDIFRPQPHVILEWMEIPLVGRKEDLVEYASNNVPLWSIPVIDALFPEGVPGRQWLSLPSPGDTVENDIFSTLMCLHYFGILDVNKSNGTLAFTRTNPGNTERMHKAGRIMVLSDFSAVLTREVIPEELYWFSKVGRIDSFDGVYRGTISRQTINDSLSEGTDGKKLIERLETWDAPPNVLATVKEWIREFSRMYITSDATIVSTDERATSQLLSYQPLQRLIEPVRSDCVFRIRTGREQEVRGILVSMGFDPRMPGETAVRKRAEPGPAFNATGGLPKDSSLGERGDMMSAVFGAPLSGEVIVPVVGFGQEQKKEFRPVKEGKYGQKLKELDMSDMYHVLDYAVLMGHAVVFEYRGSPLVKKGLYKVSPLHVQKSPEPVCEAVVLPKKAKKKFLLKCIIRIGVEPA